MSSFSYLKYHVNLSALFYDSMNAPTISTMNSHLCTYRTSYTLGMVICRFFISLSFTHSWRVVTCWYFFLCGFLMRFLVVCFSFFRVCVCVCVNPITNAMYLTTARTWRGFFFNQELTFNNMYLKYFRI